MSYLCFLILTFSFIYGEEYFITLLFSEEWNDPLSL